VQGREKYELMFLQTSKADVSEGGKQTTARDRRRGGGSYLTEAAEQPMFFGQRAGENGETHNTHGREKEKDWSQEETLRTRGQNPKSLL